MYTLAVSGGTVYACGYFTIIGGQNRSGIAALDAMSGLATAWNPQADAYVWTLAVSGSTVYAGGEFLSIGGQSRDYIAALDAVSGLATAWNPGADADVWSLAVNGSTLYAGGDFLRIGGQSRSRIAALDVTTGLATRWSPEANSYVYALAVGGSTLYAGGDFLSIGGTTQSYFAAMQDSPTPTLLARFEAEAMSGGVQLRWQFGEPDRVVSVALERAANQVGPWMPLTLESRRTAEVTEALDQSAAAGETYYYRLTANLTDGTRATFGPISAAMVLAVKVSGLTGIAPNPMSGSTRINFALVRRERVRISVVDVTGREAALLADGQMAPGSYSMLWDGRSGNLRLPAGAYFVRWTSTTRTMNRKLVVMR